MTASSTPSTSDPLAHARERIRTGPVPSWVVPCEFDIALEAEQHQPVTTLLFERQEHLETGESFKRVVSRFESMEAVQHGSQWRLQFEPKTEAVTVHYIKIYRGNQCVDQLDFAKSLLLQREEGLDRFVIHGWFTLLQVLEDVRPGDILEWAVTTRTTTPILPQHRDGYFRIPEWTSVGKYQFVVQFDTARRLQWKSSSKDIAPTESIQDGFTTWSWSGENYRAPKREANIPSSFFGSFWLQYSDCPSWEIVSAAIFEQWSKQGDDLSLGEVLNEIQKRGTTTAERIAAAIELIQDEYRYLYIDLEFGGYTPTPPGRVAQRRYGDCKDLSFLLVKLLTCLGVKARPILVHTQLRKTVANLLPTIRLFNHVIVEFEAEGKRRCVDATASYQGGGAFGRYIPDFGFGLPICAGGQSLVETTATDQIAAVNEYHETILLDTQGNPSALAVVFHTRGASADLWRRELRTKGEEEISKLRTQVQANRFGRASVKGTLQHRDKRETNELTLVQTFEIQGFLKAHPSGNHAYFVVPFYEIQNALLVPPKDRRTPLAIQKCNWLHTVEVQSPAITLNFKRNIAPRFKTESAFFQFDRFSKFGYGHYFAKCTLSISTDSVEVDDFEKYREAALEAGQKCLITLSIPGGYPKPKPSRRFGALPEPVTKTAPLPTSQREAHFAHQLKPAIETHAPEMQQPTIANPAEVSSLPQRQRERRNRPGDKRLVNAIGIFLFVLATAIFVFLLFWKS